MALAASVCVSSSTTVARKPVRKTSRSVASPVNSKQFRTIFSIYVNDLNSQSDKGALNVRWLKCPNKKSRASVSRPQFQRL